MAGREYRITIEGEISGPLGKAFKGMQLRCDGGESELIGRVRDQAELQGLLQRISDFGMTLLSVTVIDADQARRGAIS